MIIVTGTDNSGKTTLVKHISETFGIPIATRYSPLPPKDGDDWYRHDKAQLEDMKEAVYDRFLVEELVYGPTIRNKYVCSVAQMTELCNMMIFRQPLLIYTAIPDWKLLATYKDREQYVDEQQAIKIKRAYECQLYQWPLSDLCHKEIFNYMNDPDFEWVDKAINRYLTK